MKNKAIKLAVFGGLLIPLAVGVVAQADIVGYGSGQPSNLFGPQWTILSKITLPNGGGNFMTSHPSTILAADGGGISFPLPNVDGGTYANASKSYTNYLLTNYHNDLTGKVIIAVVHVSSTDATFATNVDPGGDYGTPTVRLEFQDTTQGNYTPNDYWWSHAGSVTLDGARGDSVTLVADTANPSDWSNICGQWATDMNNYGGTPDCVGGTYPHQSPAEGFAQALANVKEVSLSFGGEFYARGVAVSSGSADFQLLSYKIGSWDVTGSYTMDTIYHSGHYHYGLTLTQTGDTLVGNLHDPYLPLGKQDLAVSGTVNGDTITFSVNYPTSYQGLRTFTGSISASGTLSGSWDENGSEAGSGTWSTTSGSAIFSTAN